MPRAATFLFCAGAVAVVYAGCGVQKAGGTMAASADGSGGAGGSAGSTAVGKGGEVGAAGGTSGAAGDAGGQGGGVAGGAMGHGPVGCGGAPAALPQDCVPAIAVAPDGGPQPYARCEAGGAMTPEICDDSSAVYHCPFGYAEASACRCFVHDIDQECPDAGTN